MRSKKPAAIAGIAVAVALALTGCTSSTTTGPASTTLPDKKTTASLKIWGYLQPENAGWIDAGKAALKKEFPNVSVTYTYVPYDQIASKLLGTGVSGGAPDGVIYNPADSANLSRSGLLLDMSPFWSDFADKGQFPDSLVWKNGSKVVSVQGYVNTTALYYNQDILDKAGVAPPKTVTELGDALQAVAKDGNSGLTMSAVPTAESEFQIFPWLLGDGQNYGDFSQSGVEKVFGRFSDWISAGYVPRDVSQWTQADAWDNFSSGKYAFSQNGNWQLGLAKKLPFKWGVVPIPAGTQGSYSVGGGEGFSIGAKSKNAALTWEFFRKALLTRSSELAILKSTGSLPARKDAAADPAISDDPALETYAKVVATLKSRPNSPAIADDLVEMGKIWNAVAGGASTPSAGAADVVKRLNSLK